MPITVAEIEEAGLTIADVARRSQIPYSRIWRGATGGLQKGFEPDEIVRLQRVLSAKITERS